MLKITDAHENNLKHIDVEIPHGAITVITGVSGSGKSSLAYNVIYKESQRRFLESFSAYARHYLGKLEKPKVKEIKGLQPALAINQKSVISNPRSTVGTMSGIYDYLRLLYARIGILPVEAHGSILPVEAHGHILPVEAHGSILPVEAHGRAPLQAKLFSFNSEYGACPKCKGLGITEQIDKNKLIADPELSLQQGALVPTTPNGYIVYSQVRVDELNKVCNAHGFSVNIPWKNLTKDQQDVIWYGSDKVKILFGKHSLESRLKWKGITAKPREEAYYKGIIPIMEEILRRDRNENILRFASAFKCTECGGRRLRKEALHVLIDNKNIAELCELSLSNLYTYLKELNKKLSDSKVTENILIQVFKRLEYLKMLGLGYLNLSRESTTLSGGEAQRIRLASQVGSGLQGILYILDEPSIGLHHRDNKKLLNVLKSLRDNGNTLLVVEHDENTIKAADYLIDIGPKAGNDGGEVVYQGDIEQLLQNKKEYPRSITAQTLGSKRDSIPKKRTNYGTIAIKGASKYNLKNIDVEFKIGAFNVVTGVSGAGKSTLVHEVLGQHLAEDNKENNFTSIDSSIPIKKVIEIDQSPIGRTPRSNPATYTDLFDHIRDLFASLPDSKKRGYKKGRFSFNNVGGRCEKCQGAGYIQLGMHFLGDVEVTCDECEGKRFNEETLEITYNNKNIFDVLELSVSEARQFFDGLSKITKILDQLIALDVGYLKLGQPSTTLSGGEAQRIKLASELYKTSTGHALYILDEPTTGLHKADVVNLITALNNIIDNDNTVIIIEHDIDIIKQADHIVDLGPEGGDEGGYLIVQGNLSEAMKCKESFTGEALKELYKNELIAGPDNKKQFKKQNIEFKGINTNNLKNIDAEIPLNKTTVITGISGSGKSSLAFDTIYSESRNRFTESFSTYARRMMNKVKRPELEQCSGLTPAIAIRQDTFSKNPRSTVGTATEIYDLYRLLFSRAGKDKSRNRTTLPASMFSFNKIEAACPKCKGLGIITTSDPEVFITDEELPIVAGAMDGTNPGKFFGDPNGQYVNTLKKVGYIKDIDFSIAFNELSDEAKHIALYGTGTEKYNVEWKFKRGGRTGTHKLTTVWKGFINYMNEDYEIKRDGKRGEIYNTLMKDVNCQLCHGKRLRQIILDIDFDGMNIFEMSSLTISNALLYFSSLETDETTRKITEHIIEQILFKLRTLDNMGLGYLSLNRTTQSLSGGEAQRLRIAGQLVSDMCGITYVLDEPTIGLHPYDTDNLLKSIRKLRENGNTVILVEHDPYVIETADHIIDIGPGAGENGGRIVAEGNLREIINNADSVTGMYLSRYKTIRQETNRRNFEDKIGIIIKGANANNLKDLDIEIPSGSIVAVTGVSGSGKTSLAFDVIAESFKAGRAVNCKMISFENIDSALIIDQDKIGTSPLSTPATYTGLFDYIREIFANTEEAGSKGLKKSHFSFNSKDGRCPVCKGMGSVKTSLDFLSDVWVNCDACHGKRYKDSILEIKYKKYNIHDVLELEVNEAINVFKHHENIKNTLAILSEIGLGYIKLGQPTNTLSGGETQRLKLASKMIKEQPGRCLFIFDEPSTGLHMQDVENLISIFYKLADRGNTILVVEHNLDIIRSSDRIIDLGPEGGDKGGSIIYNGSVSEITKCKKSFTGKALIN